jgi:hypothetical protein
LIGLSTAGSALADEPESAESLFVRARTAMKAGDCTTALPLLAQSHALEPALGTRFNLALCEARLGKLTQAAEHLRSVVEGSTPGNERRAHAERALQELLPRIPRLLIEIDETRQTVESVRLDGELVDGLRAHEPFPINPGAHELEIVLAGQAPRSRRFTVAERQFYTWSLEGAETANSPDQTRRDDADVENDARAASEDPPFVWTTQRTAAVVAGGASLAAIGIGTGFALSARSIYDTSDGNCSTDDTCELEGVEDRDRARTHGRIATVAFTVGISAAFAAGVLWFTGSPRASSSSSALRVGATWRGSGSRLENAGIVVKGSY